ncbi:MAG TPA: endonuclease III domain-containing protein [Dehalococcoidia bacterium]|nr:endonuclease III domain-containing protein [Dehalococcoidia bacterium]
MTTEGACNVPRSEVAERLLEVYRRLYQAYGPQGWWPAQSPFEVMVGAILTQAAAWTNVERAIERLRAAGALSPEAILALPDEELAALVRPAGYFNAKARKLKALCRLIVDGFAGDVAAMLAHDPEDLRSRLLATYGIGPETADSILLYAAGRPYFVVDAYTQRLFRRLGLGPPRNGYHDWQAFFMAHLPRDAALYNEFHALVVRHGKERCRARPRCLGCPALEICPTGQAQVST